MREAAIIFCLFFVGACSAEAPVGTAGTNETAAPFELAQPNVVMEADSPPPFTYWAPEGSTIRNHRNAQGVWIAEVDGDAVAYYFGDECRASQYQRFIGQPVDTVPTAAEGEMRRTACSTCPRTSDLRHERLDISYDEETQRVVQVACG